MQQANFFWEYSFDLVDALVKQHYGKVSYKHAWKEIGKYLIENGFDKKDDKQGSCYFTSRMMSPQRANAVIRKMFRDLPWITLCIRKDSLTIRQENVFSNVEYAERLNNTKEHQERLKNYYNSIISQKV